MKLSKKLSHKRRIRTSPPNGYGMSEAVVAAGASMLLIAASSLALRSTQTLINRSESKATLRQNTTNGLRLLRSEIERSVHILVNNSESEAVPTGMEHTDMANEQYQATLQQCDDIAVARSLAFKPVFGIKMAELNTPVLYGLSVSSNGAGYALMRCGAPLSLDGRYSETEDPFLAKSIEDIGVMKCTIPEGVCDPPINTKSLIIEGLDVSFTADRTPDRNFGEPAFGVMTDSKRKLVKFIDPNPNNDSDKFEINSYLEAINATGTITTHPLYLAAFARADKRIENYGDNVNGVLSGAYFRNVRSKRLRFLVDGSGSMSACILWGSTRGEPRTYWHDTNSGGYYYQTNKTCAITRMESLQTEFISLISALPSETKIGIQSFSSPGKQNHKEWEQSSNGLVEIGADGMRESAIAFINSLNNGPPIAKDEEGDWVATWGGTNPWDGLEIAFDDNEADTLYFLSDGKPDTDRMGGNWTADDYDPVVDHYSSHNNTRTLALKTNTITLGLESPWMEKLSADTTGDHLQVDADYVISNAGT